MKLYDFLPSGNGYKVRLLLSQLGQGYDLTELDILKGETQNADFLALNPNGKIPTLVMDNGEVLTESNAILMYLAEGTAFLPTNKLDRARVLEWMFFEQYSHEPNIAVVRFWQTHGGPNEQQEAMLPQKMEGGYKALDVMEKQLSNHDYLVADTYSVADICLYAYTHVADEGGFDLIRYPAIGNWMNRVRNQANHKLITSK